MAFSHTLGRDTTIQDHQAIAQRLLDEAWSTDNVEVVDQLVRTSVPGLRITIDDYGCGR